MRRAFRQDDRIELLVSNVYSAAVFLDASTCENRPPSSTGSFFNAPFVKLTKILSIIFNRINTVFLTQISQIYTDYLNKSYLN